MVLNSGTVRLSVNRAAPDQRLSLFLVLHFVFCFLLPQLFFVIPARLFLEYVVCRWFSPVVAIGRPLVAHFVVRLGQVYACGTVPAVTRIVMGSNTSYTLTHTGPAFVKAGRGWATKVKANGTEGWWIAPPKTDRAKDDVVLYFVHGGGFLFDSGANCHEFFLSVIQELKKKHGLNASVFSLHYRLAPEFAYPTQLNETLAGYHYLVNTLGIPEDKIVLGGDSAGGNIVEGFLLHLARPAKEIQVPEELGETPNRPGGVLLVSPYHNLCSKSHSLETNSTFDVLDSTVATRAAFSYIGALNQLPASHRFRQPSLNPLYLFVSPQKDLPHPAERLPGVYGWSHIHGIKKFKSPYVNPAVCADKDWWKEAMPRGGKTLVSWGGKEILADDCQSLFNMLERSGVEPKKLVKSLGIHDWLFHDWSIPFSWRTNAKGSEADFYYGRNAVVDLLKDVASSSTSDARVTSAKSSAVKQGTPEIRARATAPKTPSVPGESSYATIASHDEHISSRAPVVAEGEQASIRRVDEQKAEAARAKKAYEEAPTTRGGTFAQVAAHDEHIALDAPVVAEGEGAVIEREKAAQGLSHAHEHHQPKPQPPSDGAASGSAAAAAPKKDSKKKKASAKQQESSLPTLGSAKPKKTSSADGTNGAPAPASGPANGAGGSYAAIAKHDDHVAPDAPVVAEGEGAVLKPRLEDGSLAVEKA
ncbi:uncharacterized protein JCM10292_002756 [Rhodotorula paludigena]|uniref:uncharacterized protein n=1 Tax=Rhodotorula paludigena TaxID=86838 RepID=UPI00317D455E